MYDGIVTKHIKKRKAKIQTNSLPWVDSCIRKLMNRRYKLLKQCDGTDKTTESWKEYRKVRNRVTTMMRNAETKYWREQFKEATAAREFWKVYRKATKKRINTCIGPLKSFQGETITITDDTKNAELMNTLFIDIGKDLAQNFTDSVQNKNSYVYRITPTVGSVKFNTDKLSKQLKKVNPKKASGPGSGTCKEISILQDDVKPGLEIVFDRSIQENKYSSAWKLAKVKTAHKKGEREEVTNYRPLFMLNIPGNSFRGTSV